MARLTLAIVAGLLCATPAAARTVVQDELQSPLQAVERWSPHIAEASIRFGIPERWIRRVLRAESRGQTRLNGRPIISRAGAMGLMQIMPATWASLRAQLGLGDNPHDPRDNILAGTFYLRLMYDRFGYPGLFAAYNAGPGRYARHLATGRSLPAETVNYVDAVAGPQRRAPASTPSPRHVAERSAPDPFALRRTQPRQQVRQSAPLFVPLTGDQPPD